MVPAPYGQPPVFIRGGAVLPMWPIRQHTKGPEPEEMFLDVWPGVDSLG
jgi:alpha-glucosidase (family GH31 glycosyl hydrolase)